LRFYDQDVNMNGEVDFENTLIDEPWGSYNKEPILHIPKWGTLKFDLKEDITGITIEM